jgi:hypothetical protein
MVEAPYSWRKNTSFIDVNCEHLKIFTTACEIFFLFRGSSCRSSITVLIEDLHLD